MIIRLPHPANTPWRMLASEWTFGLVDGLNGAVGLIVGLLVAQAATPLILAAILARAGASTVSMAGAEYESDEEQESQRVRWLKVGAMGLGYLTSAILPAIGFFFSRSAGVIVLPIVSAVILSVIISVRMNKHSCLRSIATSVFIFALAVAVGLAAGKIAGPG